MRPPNKEGRFKCNREPPHASEYSCQHYAYINSSSNMTSSQINLVPGSCYCDSWSPFILGYCSFSGATASRSYRKAPDPRARHPLTSTKIIRRSYQFALQHRCVLPRKPLCLCIGTTGCLEQDSLAVKLRQPDRHFVQGQICEVEEQEQLLILPNAFVQSPEILKFPENSILIGVPIAFSNLIFLLYG